jgi:hypothetical protein
MRVIARVENVGVGVSSVSRAVSATRLHVRVRALEASAVQRHKSTSRTGGTLGTVPCSRIAAYAAVRHALPYVLVREQTTRLNTSWNDSGGS